MTGDRTHRSLELPVTPDEVWDLLADDDARDQWFGGSSHLEPTPGGRGDFVEADGVRRTAVVEEARPGRRLVWTWSTDDDGDAGSRVEIDLSPVPGGTRVGVTETTLSARTGSLSALATWRGPLLELEVLSLVRMFTATTR